MNKLLPYVIIVTGLILSFAIIGFASTARADQEPIELVPVATETAAPAAVDERPIVIRHYELDKETKDTLSRLLWSSPLRSECYKKGLLWVVFNRASDKSGTFADTIKDNVTTTEFSFYDRKAHLSSENEQIVINTYDDWMSWKDGNNIGSHPSPLALYIRFDGDRNHKLVLLDINKQPLEWNPYK